MEIPLRQYLYEIGSALGKLGYELCQQAQSNQSLNIHSQVKQTMDKFTYYLHNLNADLVACRYNLIKDCKSDIKLLEKLKSRFIHQHIIAYRKHGKQL